MLNISNDWGNVNKFIGSCYFAPERSGCGFAFAYNSRNAAVRIGSSRLNYYRRSHWQINQTRSSERHTTQTEYQ